MTDATYLDSGETGVIERLLAGDETAFMMLVEMYQSAMLRIARMYTPDRQLAEEAVQETWLAVLQGLSRFERRSSLKTWIFSILINRARSAAQREGRYQMQFELVEEPTIEPDRFQTQGQNIGHWKVHPQDWETVPEATLLSQEVRQIIQSAITQLPPQQREVITLRDVEGLDAEQVCNLLTLSDGNQRVLLHRARATVRRGIETYLSDQDR